MDQISDIERRLIELRRSIYIRKTETLICFDMVTWDYMKTKERKKSKPISYNNQVVTTNKINLKPEILST